jgi:hypothetical protein
LSFCPTLPTTNPLSVLMIKFNHSVPCVATAVTLLSTFSLQAATVVSSTYAVSSNLSGNTVPMGGSGTDGAISSVQIMEFNNNHSGPIRAAATHMTKSEPGDGTFSFSAGDISPSTQRPAGWPTLNGGSGPFGGADANITSQTSSSTNATIEAGSNTTFTVTFNLGIGEVKQANLWLNYTIDISNGNQNSATVEWELKAPDTSVLGISQADTRSNTSEDAVKDTINTGALSTTLNQEGTYTLTIRADIPFQEFNNAQKTASATLDAVYFEVVTVPEPSSSLLLALGLGSCMIIRRRA